VPEAPAVIVIQLALLVAVQPQPVPAVTVTAPVAAAAVERFEDVGEMPRPHGAPGCVTVKVRPPTIIVPVREVADVFAATE